MNRSDRDLLILFNQQFMSPRAMEHEVDMLHELLSNVERSKNVLLSHEIIDLNRYKLINDPIQLRKIFRSRDFNSFVFLNDKN